MIIKMMAQECVMKVMAQRRVMNAIVKECCWMKCWPSVYLADETVTQEEYLVSVI